MVASPVFNVIVVILGMSSVPTMSMLSLRSLIVSIDNILDAAGVFALLLLPELFSLFATIASAGDNAENYFHPQDP